jgi:iron complex transport system substrate-binding protein
MKRKIFSLLLVALIILSLGACAKNNASPSPDTTGSATVSDSPSSSVTKDRQGNDITLPDTIERIMVFGPSNAEIIAGLGLADKIVAADTYSTNIPELTAELPLFDMSTPDSEQIIALEPDVIFVTGMVQAGGDDPYKSLKDAGICIIYMPSSIDLEGIMEDIRFIAEVLEVPEKSADMISAMEAEIDRIGAIGSAIKDEDKKVVYFEIAAAPNMYSFGTGVFLNEMLDIIGAKNAMADQSSWISVSDEAVLDANPDVILTSVNYIEDPVAEIMARPGWDAINAVAGDEVYYIDTDASNRPSHNVVKALVQMAESIYPDLYK